MGAATWRLLQDNPEFLVCRGYVYLPLLRDPDLERELSNPGEPLPTAAPAPEAPAGCPPPPLLHYQGRWFCQAVTTYSLVENFGRVFPQALAERRRRLLEQYSLTADLWGLSLDPHLVTIVFHILPHFLRRDGRPKTSRLKEMEVLDYLRECFRVPARFLREAQQYQNTKPLKEAIKRLQTATGARPPLPEGLVSAARLQDWWEKNLELDLLETFRRQLLQDLQDRELWGAEQTERLAVLLFLAERGSLELDGFGFSRIGKSRDYRIYKRTGPFALQDYYGRLYLFPDCRVAVSTSGRLRPVVVDHYKHPFLRRHASGQEICLRSDLPRLPFSAKNAIQALEEGINALFYGYDRRRRNGYHSLDEPPGKLRLVHFDDYRIPADHPLVLSGKVEVKNRDS